MKRFTRRMKKAAPLVLLGFLLDHSPVNQSAQALVGGPFDNNEYPGNNADGTYSGTMTGHNLIGLVTFGVDSSSESNGRFNVFHEGFMHYGAASGFADLASRRVAGSLLGVAAVNASSDSVTANPPTIIPAIPAIPPVFDANGNLISPGVPAVPAVIIDNGFTVTQGAQDTPPASGTVTNTNATTTQTLTVRTGAEGAFIAQIKGYPQAIKFQGEGRVSTTANTAITTGPTITTAAGFTIFFPVPAAPSTHTPNPSNNGADSDTQAGISGTVVIDGLPQDAVVRTETPFKIRGSRTSRQVYRALNSYTGVTNTLPQSRLNPPIPGVQP